MIYNRQKLLLQVVNVLSKKGISSKTYLVKTLFLLRQKLGFEVIGYNFFPYKFGPFSNEIYNDFNYLEKRGLFNENALSLTDEGKEFVNSLKENDEVFSNLNEVLSSFASVLRIKNFVYDNYPAFTVRSNAFMQERPIENGICSIGYEGKTIDAFLNKLIQNNVSLLVDVRKNAFSMKKGFSKNQLSNFLKKAGINYLHLPELGIESEKRKELNSKNDYLELFKEYKKSLFNKKEKIEELNELGKKNKIALMCFEADKNFCHRGILSDFLNTEVVHI